MVSLGVRYSQMENKLEKYTVYTSDLFAIKKDSDDDYTIHTRTSSDDINSFEPMTVRSYIGENDDTYNPIFYLKDLVTLRDLLDDIIAEGE